MTSRGRHNQSQDWDPIKEDYDNTYDAQYPDEEVSGGVQLDHCKLYVTNISKAINEEGLRAAFAAYGNVVRIHLSRDPLKRYALISYETPSEARLAMMKLNRTEPLRFNIHIAHKKNDSQQTQPRERKPNNKNNNYSTDAGSYRNDTCANSYRNDTCANSYRNDNDSVSSRERHSLKQDHYSNSGNNDVSFQDEDNVLGFEPGLDPELDIDLEFEQLQLDYLKLQEEQIKCKKRMLLYKKKNSVSKPIANRCILPDGRIVVRNVNDRSDQLDSTFNSAGGDSSLPALQRFGAQLCLWCGAAAEAYCARCGLAPYCGARCQQRDWARRHRAVCHNLARQRGDNKEIEDDEPADPTPAPAPASAPLRRPRSPLAASPKKNLNDESNDRPRKNFFPAGHTNFQQGYQNKNDTKSNNRAASYNKSFKNQTLRRPMQNDSNGQQEEDSWDTKAESKAAAAPVPKPAVPKPVDPVPITSQQPVKSVPKSVDPVPSTSQQPVKSVPKSVDPVPSTSQQPVKSVAKPEPVQPPPVKKEPSAPAKVEAVEANTVTPLVSVADITPTRKIAPKNYLIETLSFGDTVLLSVDAKASDCRSKSSGYVCLSLHEKCEQDYQRLCEDYSIECEAAQDCKPNPGELFSFCNPEDGAYYRARCLNPTSAALIDSSKVVTLSPTDKCKRMAPKYEAIVEFSCVLDAPNVQIGENVRITLKSKSPEGFKVQVENAETGAAVGEGSVSRWTPQVDYPVPKPVPAPVPAVVTIPEVPRPDLKNNSTMLLVEVISFDRALVRPADIESKTKFDIVLQDVVQFGMKASPIKEPPQKGQVVIGKFSDGNCYRALCRRTNVNANKYQLEYIEFGNIEVNTRETIYACPQELDLNSNPTVVSVVKLPVDAKLLTPAATEYIENLRDKNIELILTLPDGAKSAPSGAEVSLSIAKNKESVNKKIEMMCKPDWKKIEEKGGDILETQPLMLSDVEYLDLPAEGCELDILDVSTLRAGQVCGCEKMPGADVALDALTKRMEEYCNSELGKMPYLPNVEELCIAQFPPDTRWYRAVLCEQVGGPGGLTASVLYLDYGNVEDVPVAGLRKMLPEFVRAQPVRACALEIRGFPTPPTDEALAKAVQHMNIDDEGRGNLKVTRCEKTDFGMYKVDAPELLKAMGV